MLKANLLMSANGVFACVFRVIPVPLQYNAYGMLINLQALHFVHNISVGFKRHQAENMHKDSEYSGAFPVIILTGLSGAGKTTVLNVFEDMQFFTLDGLHLDVVPRMLPLLTSESLSRYKGLIIGVDVSQHYLPKDFSRIFDEMHALVEGLHLLFVDAATESIIRRYATTRRPHPLEVEGLGLEQAVLAERERLEMLRNMADLVLDTTSYSIHDLRRRLQQRNAAFAEHSPHFRVHLISFGFKYGQPAEADMMYDLRFLPNPFFVEELRPLSGKDAAIAEYVLGAEPGKPFMKHLADFLKFLLPLFEGEGRYRLAIAFGCTGGRHRSVAVTEATGHYLKTLGYAVSVEHRHLELG